MATIDVSKVGNPIAALKKLKRTLERQGGGGAPKFSDRHVKPSEKRRRAKLAAIKREKKKGDINIKRVLETTRRFSKLSVKQIKEKLRGNG